MEKVKENLKNVNQSNEENEHETFEGGMEGTEILEEKGLIGYRSRLEQRMAGIRSVNYKKGK